MRSFQLPGRSPVYASQAACATSHPAASLTAMEILKGGGNAVDAAIAASAVLCVAEPHMTGIGGDCFALLLKPGEPLIGLNGAGRAPAGLSLDALKDLGVSEIEMSSPHAVTVPGAIDAWATLLADHGTMPLADVLAPAIAMAEEGVPTAPRVQADWVEQQDKLQVHEGARQHLLRDGKAPQLGEVMRYPALAKTLRAIASGGRDAFYEGEIADDIITELTSLGGLHEPTDFAAQRASYVTPIAVTYGEVTLHELPPSNQGIVALMILKILARLGPVATDPMAPERYHAILEAARLAYAARDKFLADPDRADVPVEHMLSAAFADDLASRIDMKKRRDDLGPIPAPQGSDTIYLSVADRDGMAVSFINSIYSAFGSGIVTKKTGITLHNRGQGFSLVAGHPNVIAPGKRPMHTLAPAFATKDGKPYLSFGVMGAMFQPMGHVYVLTNMVDYGMDPQEALDCARVFFDDTGHVAAETSLPDESYEALKAMGHPMARAASPWGGGQVVCFDHEQGTLIAGSDPRKDGLALGI